jgi:hypothetical protein
LPTPCLVDQDHLTAELYNLVNGPQAFWINEAGRMVWPPETAFPLSLSS